MVGESKEIFSPPAQDTPYTLIPDARTWEWLTEPGSACPRLEEDGQWRAGLCAAGTCESRRGRPLSNATVEPGGKPEALGSQSELLTLLPPVFFSQSPCREGPSHWPRRGDAVLPEAEQAVCPWASHSRLLWRLKRPQPHPAPSSFSR